jgi:hypothetical protein
VTLVKRVRAEWTELRRAQPGKRFTEYHERHQRHAPRWARPLYVGAAILSLAVGVVLSVIPGPAFVFFGLSAALFAGQSMWLARKLDALELVIRRWLAEHRKKRKAHTQG